VQALTQMFQNSDLIALRDAVTQLGRSIEVSDLASVEASTARIKDLLTYDFSAEPQIMANLKPLVEEVAACSEELAALLASRLRAFDIAIAAWRDPDPRP